jgi:hypothetical protein
MNKHHSKVLIHCPKAALLVGSSQTTATPSPGDMTSVWSVSSHIKNLQLNGYASWYDHSNHANPEVPYHFVM